MWREILHSRLLVILPALSLVGCADAPTPAESPEPFHRLTEHEAIYAGPGRDDADPADLTEVKIGWYGPGEIGQVESDGLWLAANLAVEEVNRTGGIDGLPIRLLPAWSETPWGTGIRRLAMYAYVDQVVAFIGGPDGDSAHLVEQVAAKARVPFVSPVSTDKTTNLANVPWIFSVAPGDHVLAPPMASEVVRIAGAAPIAVVSSTDHDSRLLVAELIAALGRRNASPDAHFQFQPGADSFDNQVQGLRDSRPGVLVLIAGVRDSAGFLSTLRKEFPDLPVVAGPAVARIFPPLGCDGVVIPLLWDSSTIEFKVRDFCERYRNRRGWEPDYAEAYVFDAMNLLIDAIRQAGPNRARIRDALRDLSPWQGITGTIEWDPTGRNVRPVGLGVLIDGQLVPYP